METRLIVQVATASCFYFASCELRVENSKVPVETSIASCLFSFENRFFRHIKTHPEVAIQFVTVWWVSFNKKNFRNFLDKSHLEKTKAYSRRDFRDKADLKRHIENSNKKHEIKCNVEGCSKVFKKPESYRRHKRMHDVGPRFKCGIANCETAFTHKHLLEGHMVCHTGEKVLQCQNYPKKFIYKHNLKGIDIVKSWPGPGLW